MKVKLVCTHIKNMNMLVYFNNVKFLSHMCWFDEAALLTRSIFFNVKALLHGAINCINTQLKLTKRAIDCSSLCNCSLLYN